MDVLGCLRGCKKKKLKGLSLFREFFRVFVGVPIRFKESEGVAEDLISIAGSPREFHRAFKELSESL